MSRYLTQLARETRSKLNPPSALRLAPRAPAVFEEIHEERLAHPAPVVNHFPQRQVSTVVEGDHSDQPPVARPVVESTPVRVTPPAEAPQTNSFSPPPSRKPEQTMEAIRLMPAEAVPPLPEPRDRSPLWHERAPALPAKVDIRPVVEPPARAVRAADVVPSSPVTEVRNRTAPAEKVAAVQPPARKEREREFVIPESVRSWFRVEADRPDRPAAVATAVAKPAPVSLAQPAVQPLIDVTIGKVEVTIESDPQLPLRASRFPQSPVARPKPAPPPIAGPLARQYMDR